MILKSKIASQNNRFYLSFLRFTTSITFGILVIAGVLTFAGCNDSTSQAEPLQGSNAFGSVWVVNCGSYPIDQLSVNNYTVSGSIPALSTTPLQMSSIKILRTNYPQVEEAMFVLGDNQLSINFGGQQWVATVTIPRPPNPPLETNLVLYVFYGRVLLIDGNGQILGEFDLKTAY